MVTEQKDKLFVEWLVWETRALHLERVRNGETRLPDPIVVMQKGSIFTPVLFIPFPVQPERGLEASERPTRDSAFRVLLDYPPGYPPDARAELARASSQFERELARRMGYRVHKRMRSRSSSLSPKQLRVDQVALPDGGIYEIVDAAYGETNLSQDKKFARR